MNENFKMYGSIVSEINSEYFVVAMHAFRKSTKMTSIAIDISLCLCLCLTKLQSVFLRGKVHIHNDEFTMLQ